MTSAASSIADNPGRLHSRGHVAGHLLLASALNHLLARDESRPARWLAPSFATDVERARMRLRRVVRATDLPEHTPGEATTFGTAVDALGRDPAAVALAIRRLEITRSAALPAWEDLVRRGIPPMASPLEVATWFG
jgi:hypothetical protein